MGPAHFLLHRIERFMTWAWLHYWGYFSRQASNWFSTPQDAATASISLNIRFIRGVGSVSSIVRKV